MNPDEGFVDIIADELNVQNAEGRSVIAAIVAVYRAGFTQSDEVLRLVSGDLGAITSQARTVQPAYIMIDRLVDAGLFGVVNGDVEMPDEPNRDIWRMRADLRAYVRTMLGAVNPEARSVRRLFSVILGIRIDRKAEQVIAQELDRRDAGERGLLAREELLAIAKTVLHVVEPFDEAAPIEDFVAERDFPYCAKGRVVRIKHIVGKIVSVYPAGTKFTLLDFEGKQRREFATSYVINASQSSHKSAE